MATEAKRSGKTEVLSMRMDPKTRFMVEVLARLRGQSISTVVERAILEAADRAEIGYGDDKRTWRDYWSVVDGVRTLKMAADPDLFPNYEDEWKIEFAKIHWPFFYTGVDKKSFRPAYIDILWPKIDQFIDTWDNTHQTDYWAAGRAMQRALKDANVAAPDWPPKVPDKPPPAQRSGSGPSWDAPKGSDLDDEIPF
jgi:hypothetical protein